MISQADYNNISAEAQKLWDKQVADHGRMTNMKRTMAHSATTLGAYMEWYPLKDAVAKVIGERSTIIFAHAISNGTDCLICSTFFRRILVQWGENPDELVLNDEEKALVALGRQVAQNFNRVPNAMLVPFKEKYGQAFVVDLVGFAGQMLATNLFNNVLDVELDDYLGEFRKPI